jgi:hypothetical protein
MDLDVDVITTTDDAGRLQISEPGSAATRSGGTPAIARLVVHVSVSPGDLDRVTLAAIHRG